MSTSKVLAALDAELPPQRQRSPTPDDVIDLTTPEKPEFIPQLRPDPIPLSFGEPQDGHFHPSVSSKENEGGKKVATKSIAIARKTSDPSRPGPRTASSSWSSRSTSKNSTASTSAKPGSSMPVYTYTEYIPKPTVLYIKTEEEANEMVDGLNGSIGFDLEWPVDFRRGGVREQRTALVQLCDSNLILLIHVSFMKKFPQKVRDIIEDPAVAKMGVNIRNDGMKLYRDFGILASNLVELGALAGQADERFSTVYQRSIVSLRKVVAFYLRKSLEKGPVRTSNWEQALSREQMAYAANDAHCALMVYRRVLAIAHTAKVKLDPVGYTSDLKKELNGPAIVIDDVPKDAAGVPTDKPDTTSRPAQPAPALVLSTRPTSSTGPRPQHMRAYALWREGHGLLDICVRLRSKADPLKESTVISYVVRALELDPSLPFVMSKLKKFVQMESGSWVRHRDCLTQWENEGRGVDATSAA